MSLASSELLTDSLNFTTDGTTTAAKITATAQTLTLSTGTTLNDPVKLEGIQTPIDPEDIANKAYVDSQSGGGGAGGNPTNVQFNDGGSLGGATGININTNINLQLDEGKKICFKDENTGIQAIPDWRSSGLSALLFESTQDNIIFEHNNTNGGGGISFLVQNSTTATPNNFSILANDVNNSTSTLLQINVDEMEVRPPDVKINSTTVQIEGDNNVEKFKVVKADNLPIFTINTLDSEIQFPNDCNLTIGDDNNNFIKTQTNYQGIIGLDATLLQCNNNILVFDNINPGNGIPGQEGGISFILTSDFSTPNPNNAFTITPRDNGNIGNYMLKIKKGLHEIVNDALEINVQNTHILGDPSSQKFKIDENTQTIFQVNTLDKKVQIPGDDIELTFGPQGTSYIKTVPNWLGAPFFPSAFQIQNNQALFVLEHGTTTPGVEGGIYIVVDTDTNPSNPNPDQNIFLVWSRDLGTNTLNQKLQIDRNTTTLFDTVFCPSAVVVEGNNEIDKFKVIKPGLVDTARILFRVDTINDQVEIPDDDFKLSIGPQGTCFLETAPNFPFSAGGGTTLDAFVIENTRQYLVFDNENTLAAQLGGGIYFILDDDPLNSNTNSFSIFTRDNQTGVISPNMSISTTDTRFKVPAFLQDGMSIIGNGTNVFTVDGNILEIRPTDKNLIFNALLTVSFPRDASGTSGSFVINNGQDDLFFIDVNNDVILQGNNVIISPQTSFLVGSKLSPSDDEPDRVVEIVGVANTQKLNIQSSTTPGKNVMNVDTVDDVVSFSSLVTQSIFSDSVIWQVRRTASDPTQPQTLNGGGYTGPFDYLNFNTAKYERITTDTPWFSYTVGTISNVNPMILEPGIYFIRGYMLGWRLRRFFAALEVVENGVTTYHYGTTTTQQKISGLPPFPPPPTSDTGTIQSRITTVITVNQTAQIKVCAKSDFPGTIGIVSGSGTTGIPWPDGNSVLVFASIHIEKLA